MLHIAPTPHRFHGKSFGDGQDHLVHTYRNAVHPDRPSSASDIARAAKQVARYDRPRKAAIVFDAERYEATISPCHYPRRGDRELYEAPAFLLPAIPT